MGLLIHALTLTGFGWFCRDAPLGHNQGLLDHLRKALARDLPVARLTARVLHLKQNSAVTGPFATGNALQASFDGIWQIGATFCLKAQFNSGGDLIYILTTGP